MKSSRTERRRKLRALALVVFSALTARLLLETVPTHAVAAHTFRSLQVVAGALIASIDVLTRRRCVSCCEEVVALLRQHAVEEKNVACFILRTALPERKSRYADHASSDVVYTLVNRGYRPLNFGYLRGAREFLNAVAIERSRASPAARPTRVKLVWVLEDDASLPREVVHELVAREVSVLAHSVPNSRKNDGYVFAPNFHFIKRRGFRALIRDMRENITPFAERESVVFWRGSTTGSERCESDLDCELERDCERLPRVRAIRAAMSDVPWLDFAVTRKVQSCAAVGDSANARTARALRQDSHAPEREWAARKGVLEIDGNVDAWGNRWRMESGSVVFLVKSQYTHYYSDALEDGVHYVGISADLSDLVERTRVVADDDPDVVERLAQIAANASALMQLYTYERAVRDIATRLPFVEL